MQKKLPGCRYLYAVIAPNTLLKVKLYLFLLSFCAVQTQVLATTEPWVPIDITGKVTDEAGAPLTGVTVQVKNTDVGAITDIIGNFAIQVEDRTAILIFSYSGYETQEIDIGDRTVINIAMEPDFYGHGPREIVAVGYGEQRKVNLTGSIASKDAQFLANRPLTNSSQALQGFQGLYVNQEGGQPGSDEARIRIRGIGTLNNNDPLVLVNGIEYSLMDVDPADIESISVLKDAASAAIYGNRAANGVILITTKSGNQGAPTLEYNNYFGWQEVTTLPDMVTNSVTYMEARNQASANEGAPPVYPESAIEEFRTGTDPDLYPNTDWGDILFEVAPIQEHKLRLSGGNEVLTYSLLGGYLKQDGPMKYTGAEKYSVSFKTDFNIFDGLKVGLYATSTFWEWHQPAVGVGNQMRDGFARALPIQPAVLSDGRLGDTWLTTPGHNFFKNGVGTGENGYLNNSTLRSLVSLYAEYTIPRIGVKYKINVAANKFDGFRKRLTPFVNIYDPRDPDNPTPLRFPRQPELRQWDDNNLNTTVFHTLDWNKKIGNRHNVNLLAGFSQEKMTISDFDARIRGLPANELDELSAGAESPSVSGISSQSKLMSYFGRANYNFSDKYLVEFNFRYDGSSRFARGNRWGFFPSVSAGWRLDRESFMRNLGVISNLKLRGSWGKTGNQNIPLFSYLNVVELGTSSSRLADYSFGGNLVQVAGVLNLADPNITWETTTITDIGLDLGLWNNQLNMTIDVFENKTTDILERINVPAQVGNLQGPITNLYALSNRGIEIGLSYRNSVGDLYYDFAADVTYIDNNVDDLGNDQQTISNMWGVVAVTREGYPVDSYLLYEADGIFQNQSEIDNHAFQSDKTAPGDVRYKDLNNDNRIDENDRRIISGAIPKYTYSFNLGLEFRGFELSAFFQGVQDIGIYPEHNLAFPLYNGAGITKGQLSNSWTPDNPGATLPRLSLARRGSRENFRNSTLWLRDGSYLRLKNLQIGYRFRSELLEKLRLNGLRIFANAQNLFTVNDFEGWDPERRIMRSTMAAYPSIKTYSLGLNVIF